LIFSNLLDILRKIIGRGTDSSEAHISIPDPTGFEEYGRGYEMKLGKIKTELLVHDLKVPLSVIEAGLTSLLRTPEKYGPLTEKQKKVLVRALRNSKASLALVNDILELGRSSQGVLCRENLELSSLIVQTLVEVFDLVDSSVSEEIKICNDLKILKRALNGKGVLLNIDKDLWCKKVCLDLPKMAQILRNLLNNALKYRKSRVELEAVIRDDLLIVSVMDDGEGIPLVYHKKIFESYFQLSDSDSYTVRGHGLGLAGVMALVEDMGGSLFLESDEGEGAKFSVRVPLST